MLQRYNLDDIAAALGVTPKSDSFFDFNNDAASILDRALTAPVHAEGADGITRFEAASSALGHYVRMIRDGKMTEAEAWKAAQEWNAATLRPPWDDARLRNDFERLKRLDAEKHGPTVPAASALPTTTSGLKLTDWRADNEIDEELPARRWLVDGVIPAGTPGVFAAVGDAGKSMMALQLALYVAAYPKPQNAELGFNDAPRFLGGPVVERGAAVILTSEDDKDEVKRRLAALDPAKVRRGKPLYVVPMVSAGGARAIVTKGPGGAPVPTEFWQTLRAQLVAIPDLKLVVLDPLSSFVAADTNDNAVGTVTMALLGELAATSGAAVMVVHHFAKGRDHKIIGLSDAREAIRGAGAWVDNSRWALALWECEEKLSRDILKLLGQEGRTHQAGLVYRGGLTKGNAPSAKVVRTLLRSIATGVLEDVSEGLRRATPNQEDTLAKLAAALWEYKQKNVGFSFTASESALMTAWGPIIRKHDLPITKEGKRGMGIKIAFEALLDSERIVETADIGKTARYEPVAAGALSVGKPAEKLA